MRLSLFLFFEIIVLWLPASRAAAGPVPLPGEGAVDAVAVRPVEAPHWVGSLAYGDVLGGLRGPSVQAARGIGGPWEVGAAYAAADAGGGRGDYQPEAGAGAVTMRAAEVTGRVALVQARYFLSQTFYATMALGARQLEAQAVLTDADTGDELHMQLRALSLVTGVGVGSRWPVVGGMTVSVDWAGFLQPLLAQPTSSVQSEGAWGDDQAAILGVTQKAATRLGRAGTRQLLLVGLGYAL